MDRPWLVHVWRGSAACQPDGDQLLGRHFLGDQHQQQSEFLAAGHVYARFLANPYYGIRTGKRELPQFREVRFYLYTNAEKEVSNKNAAPEILLDLVEDLEGDFTAPGSSHHDQVVSPFFRGQIRKQSGWFRPHGHSSASEVPFLTMPMIRQRSPSRTGG